jgi:hypothetical protein
VLTVRSRTSLYVDGDVMLMREDLHFNLWCLGHEGVVHGNTTSDVMAAIDLVRPYESRG